MITLTIVMSSCQKGCTTSKTINSKSKTIKIGDQEGTITVRHIQYRRSKAKPVGIRKSALDRSVRYTYAIVWDVDFPFWQHKDVAYEGTNKNADLNKQLDRFQVIISKDQKHFHYGIGTQLMGVMHLYNNIAFEDPNKIGIEYEVVSMENVSVEDYPEPDQMIADILDKGELCLSGDIRNEYAFIEILNSIPADHKLKQIAFEAWPQCEITKKVFTADRLSTSMKKNPGFKLEVTNKLTNIIINERSGMFDVRDALVLVEDLNDQDVFDAIDLAVADKWATFMSGKINDYVLQRVKNKKYPIKPEAILEYVQVCRDGIDQIKTGRLNMKIDLPVRIQFLVRTKNWNEINYFIDNIFTKKAIDRNLHVIDKTIQKNWGGFNEGQRSRILNQLVINFNKFSKHEQVSEFNFLKKHLDCDQLRKIKSENSKNLVEQRLPLKCPEDGV